MSTKKLNNMNTSVFPKMSFKPPMRLPLERVIVIAMIICWSCLGVGCASNPQGSSNLMQTEEDKRDKFQRFNRTMFTFNDVMDRWVLKPVAKGYRWVAPKPVEVGVSNFFSNLGEVSNVVNDVLQWKWKRAGLDTSRLLINSTLGLAGLFDVAGKMGIEESDGEDFGQTLAKWGVPEGSYIVIPFLGPSTLRGGLGKPVDIYTHPVTHVTPKQTAWGLTALDAVQSRAELLDLEDLLEGDRYILMRDVYLQRRDYLISDGKEEDDFGGDLDFDDF